MLIPTQESPPKIGKHSREIFVRSLPHSISDAKYATASIFFLPRSLFLLVVEFSALFRSLRKSRTPNREEARGRKFGDRWGTSSRSLAFLSFVLSRSLNLGKENVSTQIEFLIVNIYNLILGHAFIFHVRRFYMLRISSLGTHFFASGLSECLEISLNLFSWQISNR